MSDEIPVPSSGEAALPRDGALGGARDPADALLEAPRDAGGSAGAPPPGTGTTGRALPDASATGNAGAPKDAGRGFFRENIEALFVAFVMAIVIKHFALETYRVPTPSMEPTIIGRKPGGDHLIVNKLAYRFGAPERYDVTVFKYPLNEAVNYIKRVVGLPNERLWIRYGDIFVGPADYKGKLEDAYDPESRTWREGISIARKPDMVLEDMFELRKWIKEPYFSLADKEALKRRWTAEKWESVKVESGVVNVKAEGRSEVALKQMPDDRRTDTDYQYTDGRAGPGGRNPVNDMKIVVEAKPEGRKGRVVLFVREHVHDVTRAETISLSIELDGSGGVLSGPEGWPDVRIPEAVLEAGSFTEISLANVDDRITVSIEGEEVAARDFDHVPLPVTYIDRPAGVAVEAGEASFRKLQVYRDIYYTDDGKLGALGGHNELFEGKILVPKDSYFVLGDNSSASKDSRFWVRRKAVVKKTGEVLYGDDEGVTEDPTERQPQNPHMNVRGEEVFIDVFGSSHVYPRGSLTWSDERSPFVHRDFVLGRAFVTFYPVRRTKIIR